MELSEAHFLSRSTNANPAMLSMSRTAVPVCRVDRGIRQPHRRAQMKMSARWELITVTTTLIARTPTEVSRVDANLDIPKAALRVSTSTSASRIRARVKMMEHAPTSLVPTRATALPDSVELIVMKTSTNANQQTPARTVDRVQMFGFLQVHLC
eukprot:71127_1